MNPAREQNRSPLLYILFTSVLAAAAMFADDILLTRWLGTRVHEMAPQLLEVLPTTLIVYFLLRREFLARERAVATQRASERRLANVLETATSAIIGLDREGRIFLFNRGAERIFGYGAEEVQGQSIDRLLPEASVSLLHPIANIGESRLASGRRRNGVLFPAETVLSELQEGDNLFTTMVLNDISRRKEAEEALRKSHEELDLRVRKRTRELAALLDTSRRVGSIRDLGRLFELVFDQLRIVIEYTGAAIFTFDSSDASLVAYRGEMQSDGMPDPPAPLAQMPCLEKIMTSREPILIEDIYGDTPFAQQIATQCRKGILQKIGKGRALIAIPLLTKERVIGLLRLDHDTPSYFTPRHVDLAVAVASQASIALENAHLYREARKVAALEERERLARELHDSVSQALYGIGLGANAASEMLDRDPGRLSDTLTYVRTMADIALIEMRALIFQLRPDSLENEGLAAALSKLTEAALTRHGIEAKLEIDDLEDAALNVKDTVYRICQEAIWNTAKHARAKLVTVRTIRHQDGILLETIDDGVGFDPEGLFPGHLGLKSMRERAEALGGHLDIESSPQGGTRVRAYIPTSAGCVVRQSQVESDACPQFF